MRSKSSFTVCFKCHSQSYVIIENLPFNCIPLLPLSVICVWKTLRLFTKVRFMFTDCNRSLLHCKRRTYVSFYFFFQAEIKSCHDAFLIAVFLSAEIFYLIFEELDLIWNISEKTGNLNTYFTSSFLSCCIQTQIVSMTFNVSPLCVVEEGSKIVCLNLVLLISLWSFYKFISIITTFYASSKKDVYRLRNTRLRHVFDIVFSITYVNPCLLFFIHPWSCNLFFEWNIKSIYYSLSLLGTPIDLNANWNFFFLFTVVWFTVWFQ